MALDSYEIKFFAWCKEGTHDKVWGFVEFKNAPDGVQLPNGTWRKPHPWEQLPPGSLYNFWGRRGKTYRFKRHYGRWGLQDLKNLAHKKLHPSGDKVPYKEVSRDQIEAICPGFADEFENQLLAAKWDNAIKSDDTENHSFI